MRASSQIAENARMATARTADLLAVARRIADALPPDVEEAVVTGSVSRGAADDVSDIEMLIVTSEQLSHEECFDLARAAGLDELSTWGAQNRPARRVSGYRDGVPIELIWWSREHAEESVDALLHGEMPSSADAIAHGVALRTGGALARWQERLAAYPDELVATIAEDAALPWGGFAAAGLLTLVRPGERLALLEWMVDGANRVLRIVWAVNRQWQPTHKRLASRTSTLAVKPERLAERIVESLTEPEPYRALIVTTKLQLDAVELAPSGPNVDRARAWLANGVEILEEQVR
jgi:predicted nucleotidyltransferase